MTAELNSIITHYHTLLDAALRVTPSRPSMRNSAHSACSSVHSMTV